MAKTRSKRAADTNEPANAEPVKQKRQSKRAKKSEPEEVVVVAEPEPMVEVEPEPEPEPDHDDDDQIDEPTEEPRASDLYLDTVSPSPPFPPFL
jgi:U4/U6.U5 tri-snRNP-associated protein 2